jgi:hypothetical protein
MPPVVSARAASKFASLTLSSLVIVGKSQIRAVLSYEAVTTRCPSALNCAELTSPSYGLAGIAPKLRQSRFKYRSTPTHSTMMFRCSSAYFLLVGPQAPANHEFRSRPAGSFQSRFKYSSTAGFLKLSESGAQDQIVAAEAVKFWLVSNQGWLLILDNADDIGMASAFLPSGKKGHVILTTRAQATQVRSFDGSFAAG